LAAIVVVQGVLMSWDLGHAPLWRDEIWTYSISDRPLRGVLAVMVHREANMGLYYLLAHAWLGIGRSDAWLRVISVFFALGAVVFVALMVRDLLGRRAGLMAALFLGFNPFLFAFGREARGYTMAVFFVAAATAALARCWQQGDSARLQVAWALLIVAGAYTQLLVVVVALAQFGLLLVARRMTRRWFITFVVTGLAVSPLALYSVLNDRGQTGWVTRPGIGAFFGFATSLAGLQVIGVLLSVVLVVSALLAARRDRSGHDRDLAVAALVSLVGPTLLIWLVSQAKPLFVPRFLIWVLAPFILLLVLGFERLPGPRALAIGTAILLVASWVITDGGYIRDIKSEDPRSATAFVQRRAAVGDVILFEPSWARVVYQHYLVNGRNSPADVALAPHGSLEDVGDIVARERSAGDVRSAVEQASRVWVVSYPTSNWSLAPEIARKVLSGEDAAHRWTRLEQKRFGDLEVTLYSTPTR
jgi:mannosyltransferase